VRSSRRSSRSSRAAAAAAVVTPRRAAVAAARARPCHRSRLRRPPPPPARPPARPPLRSVSASPTDPALFASGSCDSTVKIWDMRAAAAGACVRTFSGHVSDVNAVSFFPSGHAVGSGSDDAECRVHDLRSCGPVAILRADGVLAGVTDVAFSASGRVLFAAYAEPVVRAWETTAPADDGVFQELRGGHADRVSCLAVNAAGQALATGSWDQAVAVWA
jgi:guanine nucleotide-binding protein G(I)/G(S)/G(T) subunit beta-1